MMDNRVLASYEKEVNLLSMKGEYIKTCDFSNGLLQINECKFNGNPMEYGELLTLFRIIFYGLSKSRESH